MKLKYWKFIKSNKNLHGNPFQYNGSRGKLGVKVLGVKDKVEELKYTDNKRIKKVHTEYLRSMAHLDEKPDLNSQG